MWSTAVGYAGGFTPHPTYEETCTGRTGHTEVVRVIFDPAEISYAELLSVFFENHDPTQGMRQGNDVGSQYRSAVYYTDDAQREQAEAAAEAFGKRLAEAGYGAVTTEIAPLRRVLLRRGLPPAVPGQEPGRLLPGAGHRRRAARSGCSHRSPDSAGRPSGSLRGRRLDFACCAAIRTSRRRTCTRSTPPTGCCSTPPPTSLASRRPGRGWWCSATTTAR